MLFIMRSTVKLIHRGTTEIMARDLSILQGQIEIM
jgi:hypothetical protein